MIGRAWCAALLVAIACGSAPVAPAAPAVAPAAPAASAADAGTAPDAAPVDPAMAEVLVSLRGFRARACACADAPCAAAAEADQVQWGFEHKPRLDAARPTPAQDQEAREIIEAFEACVEKWH